MHPILPTRRACRRGGGIAEVLICTFLVGVMTVAALNAIGMVFRTRRMNSDRLTGPGLAQDLVAEILSMSYEDPQNPGGAIGVNVGESAANRTTFDDIDDYNGWTSTNGVGRDASARSGYTGWGHGVAVVWINPTTLAVSASETGLKRITVTVTSSGGVARSLVALRSNLGAVEQTRPISATAVTWLGAELRAGSSTRSQYAGAPTTNHVQDAN
jgi:hypothetical protein